jgi:hypothetical protein
VGVSYDRRRKRKNKERSTVKDFHDEMNHLNNRPAFATISAL